MTTVVLVPGAWLGGWAWRDVADGLSAAGHEVHAMTLTGVGERAAEATPEVDLDTHTTDIVGWVERRDLRDVVLVGHSYGGVPVAAAADRMPDRIARVVYVDSGPLPDGMAQFDMNPPEQQQRIRAEVGDGFLLPPPPWDPVEDPTNLAGLGADALALLRERATAHPFASLTQPLPRSGTPAVAQVTLIACTFPVDQVRAMIAQGHPFFALLAGADIVGLPTGHWPMFSEPKRLAELLDGIARDTVAR